MTLQEFRDNSDLVKEMRQILENPTLRMYLEAMDEQAPVKKAAPADVSPHVAHIMLGEQTGWAAFETILLSGGQQPPVPQTEPDQSYLPSPEPEEG